MDSGSSRCLIFPGLHRLAENLALTWLHDIEFSEMGMGSPWRSEARKGLALCGQVLRTMFILPSPEGACAAADGAHTQPDVKTTVSHLAQ